MYVEVCFGGGWMDGCMKANIVTEDEGYDQTVCSAYSYNFILLLLLLPFLHFFYSCYMKWKWKKISSSLLIVSSLTWILLCKFIFFLFFIKKTWILIKDKSVISEKNIRSLWRKTLKIRDQKICFMHSWIFHVHKCRSIFFLWNQ